MQRQSLGLQDPYIEDARSALQDFMQAYDPSITGQFFNPFEDRVVQQTIQDVMEQGAKSDIGALAVILQEAVSLHLALERLAAERQEALAEDYRGFRRCARGFEAQRAVWASLQDKRLLKELELGIAGLGAQAAGASLSDIALFGIHTTTKRLKQC